MKTSLVLVFSGLASPIMAESAVTKMEPIVVPAYERVDVALSEVVYRTPREMYLMLAGSGTPEGLMRLSVPGEARIADGDRILAINGRRFETFERYEGARMMVSPAGADLVLEILAKGASSTRLVSMIVYGRGGPNGRDVILKMKAGHKSASP